MKYSDLPKSVRQALGCYEGFRRLGFEPDVIFFIYMQHQQELFCVLSTQGKEFKINCGPLQVTREQWEAMATFIPKLQKVFSEEDLQRIWEESMIFERSLEFLVRIKSKGIEIPKEREWFEEIQSRPGVNKPAKKKKKRKVR